MMDKLSYLRVRPMETVLETIVRIKSLFENKEFTSFSSEITQLVDFFYRQIFSFKCTNSSFSLERTIHKNVRFCNECHKNVYQIENEFDLVKHTKENDCIFYFGRS